MKKKNFFYDKLGIRVMIIYFHRILIDMINRFIYVHLCIFACTNNISRHSSITECKTITSSPLE